jgi:O-antigen ligase
MSDSEQLRSTSAIVRTLAVLMGAIILVALSCWLVSIDRWEFAVCVAYMAILAVMLAAATTSDCAPTRHINQYLLVLWFAATPVASFFIRYPTEKSLLTFDRLVIAGLGLWLLLTELIAWRVAQTEVAQTVGLRRSSAATTWITASKFEIVWVMLIAVALLSVFTRSTNLQPSLRTAVDSLLLPLVAFRLARTWLRFEDVRSLVGAATLASVFLMITGAYELISGADLFSYKGSAILREGEFRINGPYESDTAYALIALLLAVFILAAPRLLELKAGSKLRVVCGLTAVPALVAVLLPLFREVLLALAVSWIIVVFLARPKESGGPAAAVRQSARRPLSFVNAKALVTASVLLALFVAAGFAAGGASALARLASARNALGRIATWQMAIKITAYHPVFGVGLGNYTDYFAREYHGGDRSSLESALDTRLANTPHSNIFWMVSELGIVGLVLYLAANYYLFAMGYRALKRAQSQRARAAAAVYLALLAAYWIPGLGLQSALYSDINLCYFFMLGFLAAVFKDSSEPRFRGDTPSRGLDLLI